MFAAACSMAVVLAETWVLWSRGFRYGVLLASAVALSACAPSLNWRDVTLGTETQLQFPCKPQRQQRTVNGSSVGADMALSAEQLSCEAGDVQWSATAYTLEDPGRIGQVLRELRLRVLQNFQAAEQVSRHVQWPGATPHDASRYAVFQGRNAAGQPVLAEALWITRGRSVYQLVVMAPLPTASATAAPTVPSGKPLPWHDNADEFFRSLHWSPTR